MKTLKQYLEIRADIQSVNKQELIKRLELIAPNYDPNPETADSAQARVASEEKNKEIMELGRKLSELGEQDKVDKIFDKYNIKTSSTNIAIPKKQSINLPKDIEFPENVTLESGKKIVDKLIEKNIAPNVVSKMLRGKGISPLLQGQLLKYMVGKLNE